MDGFKWALPISPVSVRTGSPPCLISFQKEHSVELLVLKCLPETHLKDVRMEETIIFLLHALWITCDWVITILNWVWIVSAN